MTYHTHFAHKTWLMLSLTLGLVLCGFASWHAGVRDLNQLLRERHSQAAERAGKGQALAGALNADGTVKTGLAGSFDTSGYRMEYTAKGAPRFVPSAACNGWDTQFWLNNGVNGYVNVLAVSGRDIYVGGQFTAARNVIANNVAKFNTVTNTWSALGTGGGNGVDIAVSALAMSGNDLYVGGYFTVANAGGTPVSVNNVAKVNTTTGVWSALGTGSGNGVDYVVNALAVGGNDLYVGGYFRTANVGGATVSVNSLAKYNTATGQWGALGTGGGNGVNIQVEALAVSGGDLYVGGYFTVANVGGTPVSVNNIAKVNTATGQWSALGTGGGNGVDHVVYALALSESDLFAGGHFTTANVGGTTINARHVAKYSTATGVWSALGTGGGSGVGGYVYALAQSGNELYVGGGFTTANEGGQPVSAGNVAKYNTMTGQWSALGTGGGNGVDSQVEALAVSGSDLYVGGGFFKANTGGMFVNVSAIAKVNTTTGVWNAVGTGGNGVADTVYALAVSGNDIYVGGRFTLVANITAYHVAKFSTLTNTWSALGTGGGNGVSYTVYTLALSGNDLYVGGLFTTANVGSTHVRVNNIAKYNTTSGQWSALGTSSSNGVDYVVYALALSGNDLYAGGAFSKANYNFVGNFGLSVNNIAKYNTLTNTWSALGTGSGNGVSSTVAALAVRGNDLYVGGNFTMANVSGTTVSANRVAKFNTTSGAWSALGLGGGNGVSSNVLALAVRGNDLYVGGNFTTVNVGGIPVSANRLAKYNTMTGQWGALGTGNGNGVSSTVAALAVSGNDLYVGGYFTTANVDGTTVSTNNIARVNTTTGQWSKLVAESDNNNGLLYDAVVYALALSGSDLFAGGRFALAGDKPSNHIARFCTCGGVVCPADVFVSTTGNAAVVNYSAPAPNGDCGMITCTPASGSTFNVGVTTVTCSSSNGNQSCSFNVTVNRVSGAASDPLVCTGPGSTVQATLVITNNGNVTQTVADTTTFTNLGGLPNTCTVAPNVGTCTVTNGGLAYNAALGAGQTVTLTYLTQVSELAPAGAQVCSNNSVTFNNGAPFAFSACKVINCPPAGPGLLASTNSPLNAQRPGSILIYNAFTSSAAAPNQQNTRLSLTNTHPLNKSYVHLFFVDGASCGVADGYVCLTPNQTTSFLASDLDPGTSGYVIAVAVNELGCPVSFNHLIGDEFVKFSSGHAANLGAEAVTAIAGGLPLCDGNSPTAELRFDGLSYSVLPHVLGADNLGSRADGNDTLLILNRIGGSLATSAATLGSVFGILYDDAEAPISFSFAQGTCQLRNVLSSSFPRTVPRYEQFIPAGRTGWLKVSATNLGAMTGAVLNANPNATAQSGAFNQGHNLHKLTTTNTAALTIPVFPPGC